MSELVKWTESGYVDGGVWTQISSSINASALSVNLETLQLPAYTWTTAYTASIHGKYYYRPQTNLQGGNVFYTSLWFCSQGFTEGGGGFYPGESLSGGVSFGRSTSLYDKERVDAFYWNAFLLFVSLPEGGRGETYQTSLRINLQTGQKDLL